MLENLSRTVVVTGHYGSGKTNLSLSLALELKRQGKAVTLADLDIVNPYFRSADFRLVAEEKGIELITPAYAGSSVDIPALTGALDARIGGGGTLIIDVGGDDDGAHALGRYAARIMENRYDMLFVVNFFRYLTRLPEEADALLREIETASRLKATVIVNNSNLGPQTTREDIEASIPKAKELASITGLPLAFTAVNEALSGETCYPGDVFSVGIHVKAPWSNNS